MTKASAVLIIPATHQQAGNALSVALGHDVEPGATYNVPLWTIADPMPVYDDPPSHYGCHVYAEAPFVAMVQAAKQGSYPQGLENAAPVVEALIVSFDAEGAHESPLSHFNAVLAANGLVQIYSVLPRREA